MKYCFFSFCLLLAATVPVTVPAVAFAASVSPDTDFSLTVPEGWELLGVNGASLPEAVAKRLDCVDDAPSEGKLVGWKTDAGGAFVGAFCVTYRKSGMGKALRMIKSSRGKQREDMAAKFIDTFAGTLHAGYAKRDMRVVDLSGDLLDAGDDLIMIMDGKVQGGDGTYMRSSTVIMHGDGMLNVGSVYGAAAPDAVRDDLDGLPLSVVWKK